jgi:hypothetical protein
LTKVRVSAHGKFGGWARRVAAVAVTLGINNIAAQSHQAPVSPHKVERDGRDLESSMNPCFISLVIIVMGYDASRTGHHSRDNDGNKCSDNTRGFKKLTVCHGNSPPFFSFSWIVIPVVLNKQNTFTRFCWMGLCQTCDVAGLYLVPHRSQGTRGNRSLRRRTNSWSQIIGN